MSLKSHCRVLIIFSVLINATISFGLYDLGSRVMATKNYYLTENTAANVFNYAISVKDSYTKDYPSLNIPEYFQSYYQRLPAFNTNYDGWISSLSNLSVNTFMSRKYFDLLTNVEYFKNYMIHLKDCVYSFLRVSNCIQQNYTPGTSFESMMQNYKKTEECLRTKYNAPDDIANVQRCMTKFIIDIYTFQGNYNLKLIILKTAARTAGNYGIKPLISVLMPAMTAIKPSITEAEIHKVVTDGVNIAKNPPALSMNIKTVQALYYIYSTYIENKDIPKDNNNKTSVVPFFDVSYLYGQLADKVTQEDVQKCLETLKDSTKEENKEVTNRKPTENEDYLNYVTKMKNSNFLPLEIEAWLKQYEQLYPASVEFAKTEFFKYCQDPKTVNWIKKMAYNFMGYIL